jgi:DNA gyrase subunit A
VGIALVKPEDEIMLITDRGQTIRTAVSGVRETGRNAQGVKLMSVGDDERVVAFEPIGESNAGAALEGSVPPPPPDEADDGEGGDEGGGDGEPQG